VCGKEKVAGIFSIICATHIFTKLLKLFPDYKDQSAQSKIIISAYPLGHKWIAEFQKSWMAIGEHILLDWIGFASRSSAPAIPYILIPANKQTRIPD